MGLPVMTEKPDGPIKQIPIPDCSMLDGFTPPGSKLSLRQSLQSSDINQHQARLMKCADQVLAAGQVYPGFAPDGSVDLRQQSRRNLNEVDAAQIGRRRESSQV